MIDDSKTSVGPHESKLIFACSGAADVGEISDRAARQLTKSGAGRIFCLAGIGGRIEPIVSATKSASKILAIDGCDMDCVISCLRQAGFSNFRHVRVTDLGMEKGKSPATDRRIAHVAEKAKDLLD